MLQSSRVRTIGFFYGLSGHFKSDFFEPADKKIEIRITCQILRQL
jgi:hypothetical protein